MWTFQSPDKANYHLMVTNVNPMSGNYLMHSSSFWDFSHTTHNVGTDEDMYADYAHFMSTIWGTTEIDCSIDYIRGEYIIYDYSNAWQIYNNSLL